MFTRPDDLSDSDIAGALRDGWGLSVSDIEYLALGFGSHHWSVSGGGFTRFVTVDDLDARKRTASTTRDESAARLSFALDVARSLRDAGLEFVVAPLLDQTGNTLFRINDRYVVAVYEFLEGVSHEFGPYPTRTDRLAVLDRIVTVHHATAVAGDIAIADDLAIPSRDQLAIVLDDRDIEWGPGPFAERAKELLGEHADAVVAVSARYDELCNKVSERRDRFVLTHGEPHRANTIDTADGVALIDWDTALLAPPERDLWALIDQDSDMADAYRERTGVGLDPNALALYRLWWDLCEICLYVEQFRSVHHETDDTHMAWKALQEHLDPRRWEP